MMKRHEDRRILPYHPEELYALVGDIAKYPEFLPWCQAARFRREWQDGEKRVIEADLIIAFKAFREKFGSKVTLDEAAHEINVDYLDGPFKTLINHWKFHPHEKGCEIEFYVEFEFKSKILQFAIGQVFEIAMQRIVGAFEARAAEIFTPIT